ncbi:MAG: HD domain-containing protein, partial [Bacillota bacterium]|nr:HD domain-containing protein [Bacillota bacterium]
RVAFILWLTEPDSAPELSGYSREEAKELIYTTAFLHDIGRFLEYSGESPDHALASEELSRPLLEVAGFSATEKN